MDSAGIKFDVTGGVNEVLVNTEKGRKLLSLSVKTQFTSLFPKQPDGSLIWNIPPRLPGIGEAFWTEYSAAADLKTKEALLRKYMKGSTPYQNYP